MNQLQREQATLVIDGHYILTPSESVLDKQEVAFHRAKAEAIRWGENTLANIKEITFTQFMRETKRELPLSRGTKPVHMSTLNISSGE